MKELSTNDIVVLVFTSALNLHERALSCQNTWLQDFKFGYLIGGNYIDPKLKMISAGDVIGEDYASASDKQYYGLKKLYEMNPDKKWFYITGCDAYIFSENLVNALSKFDSSQDYYIGGDFFPAEDFGFKYLMPRGGAGFALSNSLVKKLLSRFTEIISTIKSFNPWLQTACDRTLCYFLLTMFNVKPKYVKGFYSWPPYIYSEKHPKVKYGDENGENHITPVIEKPIAFHALSIREMYILSSGKKLSKNKLLIIFDKILKRISFKLKTKSIVNKIFYRKHTTKGYYQ